MALVAVERVKGHFKERRETDVGPSQGRRRCDMEGGWRLAYSTSQSEDLLMDWKKRRTWTWCWVSCRRVVLHSLRWERLEGHGNSLKGKWRGHFKHLNYKRCLTSLKCVFRKASLLTLCIFLSIRVRGTGTNRGSASDKNWWYDLGQETEPFSASVSFVKWDNNSTWVLLKISVKLFMEIGSFIVAAVQLLQWSLQSFSFLFLAFIFPSSLPPSVLFFPPFSCLSHSNCV